MHIIALIIVGVLLATAGADNLTVTTKYGQVKGRIQTMFDGGSYYAWQGIPYAKPPTGNLRFQAPVEPENWSGVLSTISDSNECFQVKWDSSTESEDCLYVNVFVPSNRGSEKLPVLFWIYGGAFRGGNSGFSTTGPDFLVSQGVIVVTHNYRIGPFGFLSTGDTVIPGNAGLKDQALAIKWTYENIAAFGGDQSKIVIAGQSAGSASVGYQLLHKGNSGKFRGSIQESGTPLNEWAFLSNPKVYVESLIQQVDPSAIVGNSSSEQLAYLQSLNASAIKAASKHTAPALTLPVIEPEHDGAFISQKMYQSFDEGNYNQVPAIIGCNSEEDLILLKARADIKKTGEKYDADLTTLIPSHLETANSNRADLGSQIKSIYLNSSSLFANRDDVVIRVASDSGFTRGVIKQAELMSRHTNVFFYVFSYDGILGGFNKTIDGAGRVSHAEDLQYIWVQRGSSSNEDLSKFPASDEITSKRIVKMWTNFVKYLNPTPELVDLLQNTTWPTFEAVSHRYMDIDNNLEAKTNPRESYAGWKSAYESYATKPYTTF